jgi:hypothetical protein
MVGNLTEFDSSENDILQISLANPDLPVDKLLGCNLLRYKSAYPVCENGGLNDHIIYKSGDAAIVTIGGQEMVVALRKFVLVGLLERSINFVEVDKYRKTAMFKQIGSSIVEPCGSQLYLLVSAMRRKVFLMPELENMSNPQYYSH